MKQEVWKNIKGFDGIYQISNQGRVKSVERVEIMKTGVKRKRKETIRKATETEKGYLIVNLGGRNSGGNYRVHRLVAEAFISNKKELPEVNHIDLNKKNNSVENLEWVSRVENVRHAIGHGKKGGGKGQKNFNVKLNEKKVIKIREMLKNKNIQIKEIALKMGVSPSSIQAIKRGKSWAWVK